MLVFGGFLDGWRDGSLSEERILYVWVSGFIPLLLSTWILPLQSLWVVGSLWRYEVSAILVILAWWVWPCFTVLGSGGMAQRSRSGFQPDGSRYDSSEYLSKAEAPLPLEIKQLTLLLRATLSFPADKALFMYIYSFHHLINPHAILSHGRSCRISYFLDLPLTFFLVRLESEQHRLCF